MQREDRRACRRTKWGSLADDFPQRWAGTIKEPLHPTAFASRVVILTNGLTQLRWLQRYPWRAALGDAQVAALIASSYFAVEPQFQAQPLMPHAGLRIFTRNLVR